MLRFLRRAPDRRMAPKMIGNERASALSNFFWVDLKNSPRLHHGGFRQAGASFCYSVDKVWET